MSKWTTMWSFVLASMLVVGCGQSPETQLGTAQIAIHRGKSRQALELADKVLKVQPDNVEAHLIRVKAQMMLRRLEGPESAEATLDGLIKRYPDNIDVREVYIHWAFVQLGHLLEKSDFVSSEELQKKFQHTLATGEVQADWLSAQEGQAAEALYIKARLARREVGSIDRILKGDRQSIRREIDQPQHEKLDEIIASLERRRNDRVKKIEQYLRDAIAQSPGHSHACELYAAMLMSRQAWPDLWRLSQQLTEQSGLSASLCDRMAVALIQMPTGYQPRPDRLETAAKIVGNAREEDRASIDWQIAMGRLHLVNAEHDEAREKFEQVLKQQPDDVNGRYLLAQALYGLKQYNDAKINLDKLSDRVPRSSDILTLYGLVLSELGDFAQAKDVLAQAKTLDPENTVAQQAMFQIMVAEKRLDEAGSDIIKYYEMNRTKPDAIRLLVQYLQAEGRADQLRSHLGEVQTIKPLTDEHLIILVNAYFFLEDYRQAERYARRLVERKPDHLSAHLRLAEALLMLDKQGDANRMLLELRERFPDTASVDQMLGRLYLRRYLFDRAAELLQKVVESEPANHSARILLARALANLSLTEEAFRHINVVLEENPDHVEAHALAGRIYQFTGKEGKAREHLERIDVGEIDEYRHPAVLAQIMIHQGQLEDAAGVCMRAIGMGHTDPALRLLLAGIYTKQEDYDRSEQHLLALARSQPRNPRAFGLLARFYVARGRIHKGLDEFSKLQAAGADEALTRLARSMLLQASGSAEEALRVLREIYEPLIRRGDRKALIVADGMAKIYLGQKDGKGGALAVYDELIEADVHRTEAQLRQVDIWIVSDKIKAADTLDQLADGIGATQKRLRFMIMNRYVRLDRVPQALAMLDAWMQSDGEHASLLRWKGDLLMQAGRAGEAVAVYDRAIERAPDSAALRFQLARAYHAQLNFPAAEAAFDAMAELDAGARIASLAAKGQMFLKLGLKRQAVTVFDELEKTGKPRDPRVIYAIGQAFADMGKDDQARDRLKQIPQFAKAYIPAQLLLARVEQRQGMMAAAEVRLQALLKRRGVAPVVVRELLELNIRNKQHEPLLKRAEQLLSIHTLPIDLKWNWLRLTVTINSERKDWGKVLSALDELAKLQPNHPAIAMSQIAVLVHLNRGEQAREIYRRNPLLANQPIAPLTAMLLDEPIPEMPQESGVSRYLRALVNQDIEEARLAAEQTRPHKTLFKSDLKSILDRDDIRTRTTGRAATTTALALVALQAGVYELSEQLCLTVLKEAPRFAPAHGVLVQAFLKMGVPEDEALANAQRLLPDSGLAVYLSARDKRGREDWLGCANDLKALLALEPGNHHIEYEIAMALQNAGEIEQVIPVLERIKEKEGPYRFAASNDLAYLLAQHRPQQLERAYQLASNTRKHWSNPHLHDTMGWIQHLRNDNEAALDHLCRAIVQINHVPDIHYHLGVVYKALGVEDWSRYHLKEAAEGGPDRPWNAQARALLSG